MAHQKKPRNPDHVRHVNVPGPQDETIQKQFEELLSPAIHAQSAFYRSLNLRDRILNLPLMIAAILAMLWRQIPSVCELTKVLNREGALWMRPAKVSQPALCKRLLTFPAELFQQVLHSLLPKLRERWQARQRPLPASVSCAMRHFGRIYAVDGSALEALFRKLEALRDTPAGALAEAQEILIHCGAVSYCVDQLLRKYMSARELLDVVTLRQRDALEALFQGVVTPVWKLFEGMGETPPDLPTLKELAARE
jgi:hypothetical protein